MPTIPLMADPTNPNGSHRVAAPGGYEGWHFDATSDDGRVHVVAALHEAWGLDPTYLRRYAWYRKFPTRLRPPRPGDYPAVTFALCEAGRETIRFTARAAQAGEVRVSDDGRSVRVGGSHAERSAADESIRLHLRGMSDGGQGGRTIAADLTFRPIIHANREVTLLDSPAAGLHRWVIVDPLCEVEGEVSVFDSTGSGAGTPRGIAFAGRGYHDHRYGTRPLPLEGFGGRVLLEDRALAFEQIGGRDVAMLLTIGKDTTVDISSVPAVGEGANLNLGMIHLSRPTVLESDRFQTVLTYQARVGGETGVALCRKLHRRRWAPLT